MAVAAHRGMENPFSGSTRVGPRAHLSAEKQERRLSVTADPQSATRGTRWEGKRLKAAQISMKINRWLAVNHRLSFLFLISPRLSLFSIFICSTWQSSGGFYSFYVIFLSLETLPRLLGFLSPSICAREPKRHELSQVFFSSSPHSLDCRHYTHCVLFHSHCNWRRCEWKQGP